MKINSSIQKYAILLFVFSINFENIDLFNLGVNFLATKLTICLLLLTSILNARSLYSFKYYKTYIYPLVTYFVLLTVISFINRTGTVPSFDMALFLNILIFIILINYSSRQPDILLKGLVVFAISTFISAIAASIGLGVTEASAALEGRTAVFGMNHNMLGLNAVISLFIIISVVVEKKLIKGQSRYLLLLFLPFILNLMVETGSRVALISFFLGIAVAIFFKKPYITLKKVMLVIGAVFVFALLWQVYLKNTLVAERLFNSIKEGDLSGRDLIWIPVSDIISNNYLWGVGKTGYARDIAGYMYLFTITPENITGVMSPHNVFIEVVCYTGILGLSFFLIFFYRVSRNAIKRIHLFGEYLPITLIIPILGLMLSGQIFDQKIVWVLLAYIATVSPASKYKRFQNQFKVGTYAGK